MFSEFEKIENLLQISWKVWALNLFYQASRNMITIIPNFITPGISSWGEYTSIMDLQQPSQKPHFINMEITKTDKWNFN